MHSFLGDKETTDYHVEYRREKVVLAGLNHFRFINDRLAAIMDYISSNFQR